MSAPTASNLVEIRNLSVSFKQIGGVIQAVRGVTLNLAPGESLGIVGESGSGKSVSCMAIMGLLKSPPARIKADVLELRGMDMQRASKSDLTSVRGVVASMVFQDPMTAFDPVFTIGKQIVETIRTHRNTSKSDARAEALDLLKKVEIRNAEAVLDSYPHQLSGGMLQRSMIAMALSCQPQVLFADEPTTALDVTVQAQILQLIKDLQEEMGMGLIMITHDLGVIAETVDRVVVMYGGKVMEQSPVADIFDTPVHPYSRALLASMPGAVGGRRRLTEIPGGSPDPSNPPNGCPFHPRCPAATSKCAEGEPELSNITPDRVAACWNLEIQV